jgi:hypothetical protein
MGRKGDWGKKTKSSHYIIMASLEFLDLSDLPPSVFQVLGLQADATMATKEALVLVLL